MTLLWFLKSLEGLEAVKIDALNQARQGENEHSARVAKLEIICREQEDKQDELISMYAFIILLHGFD